MNKNQRALVGVILILWGLLFFSSIFSSVIYDGDVWYRKVNSPVLSFSNMEAGHYLMILLGIAFVGGGFFIFFSKKRR